MIFLYILCLLTVLPSSISTLNAAQYYNLNLIYNTFNGQNWRWQNIYNTMPDPSRWDFTNYADPCINQWQGVICGSSNLTIVELSLSDYNLSGTFIDPIFTNLTTIEYLDLSLNKIQGSLPDSLYYLSNLKNISFNQNSISGSINKFIQNFTFIQHFDLSLNKLSGVIPDTLYDCDKLDYLNLTGNAQLSGSLSNKLGKLSRLRVMSIGSCNISYTVPSSIGNLSKLEYLYLGYNKLSGSLPSSLGNLTNLEKLIFWFNDLNGTIPETIYSLRVCKSYILNYTCMFICHQPY
jgi:Leucine-rich repeat (LRR) protein